MKREFSLGKNVMIDIETLGKSPDGVIVSIGAVSFSQGGLEEEFYEVVDRQSCVDIGLKVDVPTVEWWLEQSKEAGQVFKESSKGIKEVLYYLRLFIGGKGARVWGNGCLFDNCILTTAYNLLGENTPWGFRGDMCYRTIKNLVPEISIEREGVHHNALDDAKSQARHLIKIAKHLNITL